MAKIAFIKMEDNGSVSVYYKNNTLEKIDKKNVYDFTPVPDPKGRSVVALEMIVNDFKRNGALSGRASAYFRLANDALSNNNSLVL